MSLDSPAIRIEGLVKDYGTVHAVRGIDLEVRRGEVFGFLGPNGAGKTTTIRCLLDLLRPPVSTAATAALDQLSRELEAALSGEPELVEQLERLRRRTELGLD